MNVRYKGMELAQVNRYRKLLRDTLLHKFSPQKRLKMLGKGYFSWIYASGNDDKVLRISVSPGSESGFYRDNHLRDTYFHAETQSYLPKTLDLLEDLNDWLFEECERIGIPTMYVTLVERLEPLKNRSLKYHANKALHLLVDRGMYARGGNGTGRMCLDNDAIECKDPDAYLKKTLKLPELANFEDYAEGIGHFAGDYHLNLDRVTHDIMQRPSTGELVIPDPLIDLQFRSLSLNGY